MFFFFFCDAESSQFGEGGGSVKHEARARLLLRRMGGTAHKQHRTSPCPTMRAVSPPEAHNQSAYRASLLL